MGERLSIVRLVPERVLDWWSALGASEAVLASAYPKAELLQVLRPGDAAPAQSASRWRRWFGRSTRTVAAGEALDAQAGLLWSSMSLHWAIDVPALMRDWHRALAVDGFMMFSTLGPGTLSSLSRAYLARGWGSPFAPWIDMHDLGDMMVEAGFADPVMDQETLRLTWSGPEAALAELQGLGANADRTRHPGLRTPRWRAQLLELLDGLRDDQGRCVLEFEVVYGHAFRPVPRPRVAAQTEVGLDDMKLMLRNARSDN